MAITRREVLGLMMTSAVMATVYQSPASAEEIIVRRIRDGVSHPESARAIAARAGGRRTTSELIARLCPDESDRVRLAACSQADFQAWMSDRFRADFAEGNIEMVDGWLLSRTEVLVAAIAA